MDGRYAPISVFAALKGHPRNQTFLRVHNSRTLHHAKSSIYKLDSRKATTFILLSSNGKRNKMRPSVYWSDMHGSRSEPQVGSRRAGRLAIMARPRAGEWLEDEVSGWKAEGIDTVVSLLERDEVEELGLGLEATLCALQGIEFISFPIADRGVPSEPAAATLSDVLVSELGGGKNIAIHCRAGIGRSSVVAACVMVGTGFTAAHAFDQISAARGVQVPDTDGQRAWVESFRAAR
jgi:protein-tyrosine phosphatase